MALVVDQVYLHTNQPTSPYTVIVVHCQIEWRGPSPPGFQSLSGAHGVGPKGLYLTYVKIAISDFLCYNFAQPLP